MPVRPTLEACVPDASDARRVENALCREHVWIQKRFRPVSQRPAQPGVQGYAKAHFRTVDQSVWHMAPQNLPEEPLASPTPDFHPHGKSPCEFDYAVIQKGSAGFE